MKFIGGEASIFSKFFRAKAIFFRGKPIFYEVFGGASGDAIWRYGY